MLGRHCPASFVNPLICIVAASIARCSGPTEATLDLREYLRGGAAHTAGTKPEKEDMLLLRDMMAAGGLAALLFSTLVLRFKTLPPRPRTFLRGAARGGVEPGLSLHASLTTLVGTEPWLDASTAAGDDHLLAAGLYSVEAASPSGTA